MPPIGKDLKLISKEKQIIDSLKKGNRRSSVSKAPKPPTKMVPTLDQALTKFMIEDEMLDM